MKKFTIIIAAVLFSMALMAQTPDAFKYQAVARTSQGVVMDNQNISVQISILESGSAIYTEEHTLTTNTQGLFSLDIGQGATTLGDFGTIDWSTGSYAVEVAMDENGGSSYTVMGSSPLLTVPYAMHAKTAENTFSGDYGDLTNVPDMSNYDTDVTDDFSGDYNDLTGAPVIPVNTSDLNNDSGFITNPDDADADSTNEIQDLTLTGSSLSIENGNSVDLSQFENFKKMSLDVMSFFIEGNAFFRNAYAYLGGLIMPESGSSSIGSVTASFIVPDNYQSGDDIFIRFVCSSASTGEVRFEPNFISISRSGVGFISGGGASTGLQIMASPNFSAINTPIDVLGRINDTYLNDSLQPGDAVIFGFYRYGAHTFDTSTDEFIIHGVEIYY